MAATSLALQVGSAAAKVRAAFSDADPPLTNHLTFGASSPGSAVFAFATDADLERARSTGLALEITERMREELRAAGCTRDVARKVGVALISEEDVDRQGGPMAYFR